MNVRAGSRARRAVLGGIAAACLMGPGGARAQEGELVFTSIGDVARLAEIMGGAHYLRITCEGSADQTWRDQMKRLLDLEGMEDDGRRRRLIRAFNDGYRGAEDRHGSCTDRVRGAEGRLAAEGRRLAERLGDRYLD